MKYVCTFNELFHRSKKLVMSACTYVKMHVSFESFGHQTANTAIPDECSVDEIPSSTMHRN